VNAEQASKSTVAEADPSDIWGRPMPLDEIAIASNGSAGVMAPACMEEEIDGTREAPTVGGRGSQPELREEQAGSLGVADRFVLLMKPGNAGGGKEPDFWRVTGRDQESGDWRSLSTPSSDSAVTEGTLLTGEDCSVLGVTPGAKTTRRVQVGEASRRARCGKSARRVR
jgi:hypothetical protein